MKAIEYDAYGGIERLTLRDVPSPQIPAGGVRARVVRAALNPKDALVRKGKFRRLSGGRFPKRSGLDFAGEVTERRSPRFRVGDRVFGMLEEVRCLRGTLAEEVTPRATEVAHLPRSITFDDGAAVALVGLTALQALRDIAHVGPGARVLVNGGSGGVGTVAIQIARRLGGHVTSVSSAANLSLCAALGAERTLDYARDDIFGAGPFECIFDVFGSLQFDRARRSLAAGGAFVSTVPSLRRLALDVVSRFSGRGERLVVVRSKPADLDRLTSWLLDGSLRAVVDSHVPLTNVADGFRRLESKRARGKILVDVEPSSAADGA